jgi:hypothetical protein
MQYLVGLPSHNNLTEVVELALARCRAEIRQQAEKAARQEVPKVAQDALAVSKKACSPRIWKPIPTPGDERERLTRREQRHDRYQREWDTEGQALRCCVNVYFMPYRRIGFSNRLFVYLFVILSLLISNRPII